MPCLKQLGKGLVLPPKDGLALVERLSAFCSLFSLYLSTLHDAEFYREIQGKDLTHTHTHMHVWV